MGKMETLITIFTPVYNRAHTIGRLYRSLAEQTDFRFEWLVVDDGSEDGTESMVRQWMQAEGTPFAIRYYRQENGGKHRAINRGVQLAQGEAFFIVDSDDYIVEDAVRWIHEWWKTVSGDSSFAGVSGLKGTESGQVIGDCPLFDESVDAANLERGAYGLLGDKAEVYKTSVLKRYPFPDFEGENFLTEGVVWDRIAHDGLKLRWFNRITTICEYREDGLTSQGKELFIRNPKGWALYLVQTCEFYRLSPSDKMSRYFEYYINLKGRIADLEIQENLGTDGETMGGIERLYRSCIKNTVDKIGRRIALYGAGNRGQGIFALYKDSEVEVVYVLDRRKRNLSCVQIGLYDEYPLVDAIIVTPKEGQDEILDFLRRRTVNRLIGYDEWKGLIG